MKKRRLGTCSAQEMTIPSYPQRDEDTPISSSSSTNSGYLRRDRLQSGAFSIWRYPCFLPAEKDAFVRICTRVRGVHTDWTESEIWNSDLQIELTPRPSVQKLYTIKLPTRRTSNFWGCAGKITPNQRILNWIWGLQIATERALKRLRPAQYPTSSSCPHYYYLWHGGRQTTPCQCVPCETPLHMPPALYHSCDHGKSISYVSQWS